MRASSEIGHNRRQLPIRSERQHTTHKYQALDLVLKLSLEMYILTGKEYFRSAMACSSLMNRKSAEHIFAGWLLKQEGGLGWFQATVRRVYEKYHCARVKRCFLRSVSIMPNVALAGSYPAEKYLEKEGLDTWTPNHVNIFVACRRDADIVSRLYREYMYQHFRLIVDCTTWTANGFPYSSDDFVPISGYADVSSDGGSQTGTEISEVDEHVEVLPSATQVAHRIIVAAAVLRAGGANSDVEYPRSADTAEEVNVAHGHSHYGDAAHQHMNSHLLEHQRSSVQAVMN